jgi:hypothetical protein
VNVRPSQEASHQSLWKDFDGGITSHLVNPRDLVDTPDALAKDIVAHFLPQISGRVLEPCEGGGAFTRAFAYHGIKDVTALEITRGSDFLKFHEKTDWIVTNPPWSLARRFLKHACEVADNVVFLIPIAHVLSLRVRVADMDRAGFGIKEVLLCRTPDKPGPQSGFQLAAVHFQRGYVGGIFWGGSPDSSPGPINEPASVILPPYAPLKPNRSVPTLFWACPRPTTKH